MSPYRFPGDFLWGSATSAFQVEGDCMNHDFYDWAVKGRIKDGTNPNDAVLHYRKYVEDIDLYKAMNHNAARIGLEWARIEPDQGSFDEEVLEHYRDELTRMKAIGLSTMVTIHHFTNPLWLVRQGGWKNPRNIECYLKFVETAVSRLGDLVDYWLTINEPNVVALMGYLMGEHPPGEKSMLACLKVGKNMGVAHCRAYRLIHRIYLESHWGEPKVGWSMAWPNFEAVPGAFNWIARALVDRVFLTRFMDRVKGSLDFVGLQYYYSNLVWFPAKNGPHPGVPQSKLGWSIMPDRFYKVLKQCWDRYRIPIIVTENGVCDDHDELRPGYLVSHLYHLWRAIQDGVDVRGYFVWSTMDNFEVVDGVCSPFGLVHVDHTSPEKTRTIKPSGHLYAEIIREGGLTDAMLEQYGTQFLTGKKG
ncbi:MAG TPA: glycoside hydrolase family 1 protein [Bacillota bacterium]|nr:glycoside hydrolase family 1 protein [Bacillota bacterium]